MKYKNRKQKNIEYDNKYINIPRDYRDRIEYIIREYNINEKQMINIIDRKINMENNIYMEDPYLIVLYEEPEGTPRPRFRVLKSNYMDIAKSNPSFVHVYQPNAQDDQMFMKRLTSIELDYHHNLIQTPCCVTINCYFKCPSSYTVSDIIIAEYGLDWNIKKPDWDNIGKKYSDMYNTNIWLDDSMVISGTVNKFYSILPRVEIYLRYMNCAPNKQQYNSIIKKKEYNSIYPIKYIDKKGNIIK